MKRLREKAADRNPDEFRFAILRSQTHSGGQKVADRGNKALSTDAVKLLKTQDAGYLAVAAQRMRNERLKLEQAYNLRFSEDASENLRLSKRETVKFNSDRVVFVDSKEAQADYGSSKMDDHGLDSDHSNEDSVPTRSVPGNKLGQVEIVRRALLKKRKRQQETREVRLKDLERHGKEIAAAQRELSLQRARISSAIGGITKAGVRWKVRERKK